MRNVDAPACAVFTEEQTGTRTSRKLDDIDEDAASTIRQFEPEPDTAHALPDTARADLSHATKGLSQ